MAGKLIRDINSQSALELDRQLRAPQLLPVVERPTEEDETEELKRHLMDAEKARQHFIRKHVQNTRTLKALQSWETVKRQNHEQLKKDHLAEIARLERRITELRRLLSEERPEARRVRRKVAPSPAGSRPRRLHNLRDVAEQIAWFNDYRKDAANTTSFEQYKTYRKKYFGPVPQFGTFVQEAQSIEAALRDAEAAYRVLVENLVMTDGSRRVQMLMDQNLKTQSLLKRQLEDLQAVQSSPVVESDSASGSVTPATQRSAMLGLGSAP